MMSSKSKLNLIYNEWLRSLPDANSISEDFSNLESDEQRAQLMFNLFLSTPTKLFSKPVGKDNATAKELRELGNKKYASALYDEALEFYTKSIAYATNNSQEIILALGNRAASLLNLGYIAEALVDLQRALAMPNIDEAYQEKLLHRQEVCMNRIIETKEPFKGHSQPTISKKNQFFDSTCDKVILAHSKGVGRHLVAKDHVVSGEVLAIEKPYSSVLLPICFYTHCSRCFLRAPWLLECSHCTHVLYCSTECLNKDSKRHNLECNILESLLDLEIGKMDFLAIRILMDALCEGHNINKITKKCCVEHLTRYESLDVRRIYDLVGNTEKRSVADLFKRTFTACAIVEALRKFTNFFDVFLLTESAAGGFMLHFLQSLPCNAHEITEMVKGNIVEIGAGAYATLSLLNHSCEPNVVRHSNGNVVVLRAIRPIEPGQELVDNYGYHYAIHDRSERQSSLLKQYHFVCLCEACQKQWPLYSDIPATLPAFKSPVSPEKDKKYREMTKKFLATLDLALANKVTSEALTFLCTYLDFLDSYIERPWKNFNKCQEAIKYGLSFYHDFNRQ